MQNGKYNSECTRIVLLFREIKDYKSLQDFCSLFNPFNSKLALKLDVLFPAFKI
jgi:hypothetical protein